jgi:hypothetical protein
METLGTDTKGQGKWHFAKVNDFELGPKGRLNFLGKQDREVREGCAQGLKYTK